MMMNWRKLRAVLSLAGTLACGGIATRGQDLPSAPASLAIVTRAQNAPSAPDAKMQSQDSASAASASASAAGTREQGPASGQRQSGGDVLVEPVTVHRFWDTTNDLLFAGVGASRTLDYFSTLNMRRRGRQEILLTNDVVDNHAAFAAIEVAGTATSIGVSYLFHHYGHHSLERWTSIIHIGLATTGGVRNYCLKTAHPAPAPGAPANATFGLVPALSAR